jgi:hypothetical protein
MFVIFSITIMQKTKQPTSQNDNPSQSDEQEFEKRYQDWVEREMLSQDNGAFYNY